MWKRNNRWPWGQTENRKPKIENRKLKTENRKPKTEPKPRKHLWRLQSATYILYFRAHLLEISKRFIADRLNISPSVSDLISFITTLMMDIHVTSWAGSVGNSQEISTCVKNHFSLRGKLSLNCLVIRISIEAAWILCWILDTFCHFVLFSVVSSVFNYLIKLFFVFMLLLMLSYCERLISDNQLSNWQDADEANELIELIYPVWSY